MSAEPCGYGGCLLTGRRGVEVGRYGGRIWGCATHRRQQAAADREHERAVQESVARRAAHPALWRAWRQRQDERLSVRLAAEAKAGDCACQTCDLYAPATRCAEAHAGIQAAWDAYATEVAADPEPTEADYSGAGGPQHRAA